MGFYALKSPPPPPPPQVIDAESMQVVRKIEAVSTVEQNRPRLPVIISECGEL